MNSTDDPGPLRPANLPAEQLAGNGAIEREALLSAAGRALLRGQIARAEGLLLAHLRCSPADAAAIRMLADIAAHLERLADAGRLLEHCLALAPRFDTARYQYAVILHRLNKPAEALRQLEQLVTIEPNSISYRTLQAGLLAKIGEHAQSIRLYADVLTARPDLSRVWLNYGHALASAGRMQECVSAYRNCIQMSPRLGEAYWSLANLKTFGFEEADKSAMRAALSLGDLREADRVHFDFAMGKALEDDGEYADSFAHYARANALRRTRSNYSADDMSEFVRQSKETFSAEFFAHRIDFGLAVKDPIFIVGMPRAGSTLVEQILASHSQVEGTMELPDIVMMAGMLATNAAAGSAMGAPAGPGHERRGARSPSYPGLLARLTAEACQALGQQYLDQTRVQRKTARPMFIDKTPHNFLHIGLIRLALPKAKIIDARRHPMACCFSGFKQQFADGHRYTFSLEDIGRYYRDYVELMDHFERVMPGKVHRLLYEDLVDAPEPQIRKLLSYCELEFESSCLRFYENDRAVRTPSAQQVRLPLYRDAIEHWRYFEPWLQPLKSALGAALDEYPREPRP